MWCQRGVDVDIDVNVDVDVDVDVNVNMNVNVNVNINIDVSVNVDVDVDSGDAPDGGEEDARAGGGVEGTDFLAAVDQVALALFCDGNGVGAGDERQGGGEDGGEHLSVPVLLCDDGRVTGKM